MTRVSALTWCSRVGAYLVAAAGVTALVGWIWNVPILTSLVPGFATMKVNAACCFVAAGLALLSLQDAPPGSRSIRVARALAVLVTAVGALTMIEYLLGLDLHIDELVLREGLRGASAPHPGRMAPATAFNFLLVGMALLGLKARQPSIAARAHWLAVPALFVATLVAVAYAYGITSIYDFRLHNSMALLTAIAFLVLTFSILASDSAHGIVNIATSDTAGGMVARRLLPTIPLVLFGLGWLCLKGNDMGLYNAYFGLALMVLLGIAVCVHAVASTAIRLHVVDLKRQGAEAEILAMNAGLERRVQERTQELENSLAQVKQLHGLLPICAWCKKIRDDHDYWQSVEQYVTARADVRFSHDICPECQEKVLAEEAPAT